MIFARTGGDAAALGRVEAALRARFGLGPEDLVLVSEEPARLAGGPETATTALFWHRGVRHRLRIFKPAAEVTAADLPGRSARGALADAGEADCC